MTMTQESPSEGLLTGGRIVSIVLVLIVVAWAIANWNDVEVSFLFMRMTMPMTVLIIGTLVVGYVAGWLNRGRSR
jgi:uncharacterized integral membrane protein